MGPSGPVQLVGVVVEPQLSLKQKKVLVTQLSHPFSKSDVSVVVCCVGAMDGGSAVPSDSHLVPA